eukprot:tig00001437_g8740.t1
MAGAEDEELAELLREQEEFLRSASRPAARVLSGRPPPLKTAGHAAAPQPSAQPAGPKVSISAQSPAAPAVRRDVVSLDKPTGMPRHGIEVESDESGESEEEEEDEDEDAEFDDEGIERPRQRQPEEQLQESIRLLDEHERPIADLLKGVVERSPGAFEWRPPAPPSAGFPRAAHRSQMPFPRRAPAGATPRATTAPAPATFATPAAAPPPPALAAPRDRERESIEEENRARLAAMSREEIEEARSEVLSKVDPAALAAIRARRRGPGPSASAGAPAGPGPRDFAVPPASLRPGVQDATERAKARMAASAAADGAGAGPAPPSRSALRPGCPARPPEPRPWGRSRAQGPRVRGPIPSPADSAAYGARLPRPAARSGAAPPPVGSESDSDSAASDDGAEAPRGRIPSSRKRAAAAAAAASVASDIILPAYEADKLAWMQDAEPSPAPAREGAEADLGPVERWRFDFEGRPVPPGQEPPSSSALYHHGEEPGAAGYTIEELYMLIRSSVPGQRAASLRTLAAILRRLYSAELPRAAELAAFLSANDVAIVLRCALDDPNATVVLAASQALHALFLHPTMVDEGPLADVHRGEEVWPGLPPGRPRPGPAPPRPAPRGEARPPPPRASSSFLIEIPSQELEPEDPGQAEEDEAEAAREQREARRTPSTLFHLSSRPPQGPRSDADWARDDCVHAAVTRMGLLHRVRYLLEVARVEAAVPYLLDILVRCARHSPALANEIARCPRLLETVRREFVEADPYGVPQPAALRLLRALCEAGRHVAERALVRTGLADSVKRFFLVRAGTERGAALAGESLRLWRALAAYGLDLESLPDLFGRLLPYLRPPAPAPGGRAGELEGDGGVPPEAQAARAIFGVFESAAFAAAASAPQAISSPLFFPLSPCPPLRPALRARQMGGGPVAWTHVGRLLEPAFEWTAAAAASAAAPLFPGGLDPARPPEACLRLLAPLAGALHFLGGYFAMAARRPGPGGYEDMAERACHAHALPLLASRPADLAFRAAAALAAGPAAPTPALVLLADCAAGLARWCHALIGLQRAAAAPLRAAGLPERLLPLAEAAAAGRRPSRLSFVSAHDAASTAPSQRFPWGERAARVATGAAVAAVLAALRCAEAAPEGPGADEAVRGRARRAAAGLVPRLLPGDEPLLRDLLLAGALVPPAPAPGPAPLPLAARPRRRPRPAPPPLRRPLRLRAAAERAAGAADGPPRPRLAAPPHAPRRPRLLPPLGPRLALGRPPPPPRGRGRGGGAGEGGAGARRALQALQVTAQLNLHLAESGEQEVPAGLQLYGLMRLFLVAPSPGAYHEAPVDAALARLAALLAPRLAALRPDEELEPLPDASARLAPHSVARRRPLLGGRSPFYFFYRRFVEAFAAEGYGHATFAQLVLAMLAAHHPPAYRQLLWRDHADELRLLRAEPLGDPGAYLYPVERDGEVLRGYEEALVRGRELPPFLRRVALHHTAARLFGGGADCAAAADSLARLIEDGPAVGPLALSPRLSRSEQRAQEAVRGLLEVEGEGLAPRPARLAAARAACRRSERAARRAADEFGGFQAQGFECSE